MFDPSESAGWSVHGRTRFIKTQLTVLRYFLRRSAVALAHNEFGDARQLLSAARRAHQQAAAEIPKLPASDDSQRLAATIQIHTGDIDALEQQITKNEPST